MNIDEQMVQKMDGAEKAFLYIFCLGAIMSAVGFIGVDEYRKDKKRKATVDSDE